MPKIVVRPDRCKGCMLCVPVCPKKLLKASNEFNRAGYHPVEFADETGACTGCGFCYQICPDVCIEVHR